MFVQRNDARLMSFSFGRGPQTLLCIGGWVGSGDLWFDLFAHLPHWRCVSMDHRGSGGSSHGPAPITVDDLVDDLLAVADAQQVGRCVLAAESSGVGVALQAVLKAPERFAGLVLVGGGWKRPAPRSQDLFIARLRDDHDSTLKAFIDNCLPETDSPDLRRWGMHFMRRAPLEHALQLLQCRVQLTVQDKLERIALPTLVLHGTADRINAPEDSQELARRLPCAALHLLPGLGHVPMITAPAEVAGHIDRHFCALEVQNAAVRPR